jgi:excisionase family DNA binding protein
MTTEAPPRPKRAHVRPTGEKPVLLSVRDAARLLGVGESTLWRSASRGEILKVRVGRRVLIPRSEIDRIAAGG